MNKIVLFGFGLGLTIAGMILLMRHWQETLMVFWGVVPCVLAVFGLVLMFAASIKR